MTPWNDTQPIFIQIRDQLIGMILTGEAGEGEALPSVRQIAMDLSVNPLTANKAYQSLVDLGVVEKRRGLGMFVRDNARDVLLQHERQKFLDVDWPRIKARIDTLQLSLPDLMGEEPAGPAASTENSLNKEDKT